MNAVEVGVDVVKVANTATTGGDGGGSVVPPLRSQVRSGYCRQGAHQTDEKPQVGHLV